MNCLDILVMLCPNLSIREATELLDVLKEEYGIVPSDDLLSEEGRRMQTVRKMTELFSHNFFKS